jgi:hypothetical protein
MKKIKIKTIDIHTKTWFDKIFGNTYFSQQIVLNYGLKDHVIIYNPFQYGYCSFDHDALKKLIEENYLPEKTTFYELKDKGIIIRNNVEYNCKKKDVTNFGGK